MRDRLAPGGVLIVNVGHPEGQDDLEKVLTATIGGGLPACPARPDRAHQHAAASRAERRSPRTACARRRRPAGEPAAPAAAAARRLEAPLEGGDVYTDDKAPVEWLIDKSIVDYAAEIDVGVTGFPDVAIVGGGIVGCAAAAFLAESGARVELFERSELAGAASGRNSGSIQHPFDPVLAGLHFETLRHYRELAGFHLPEAPAGVLMLAGDRRALEPVAADIARDQPELEPALLDPRTVVRTEPRLARKLWGCRLETGWPVRPAAATLAFAERARRAGAVLHEGRTAWPWVMGGGVRGVLAAESTARRAPCWWPPGRGRRR